MEKQLALRSALFRIVRTIEFRTLVTTLQLIFGTRRRNEVWRRNRRLLRLKAVVVLGVGRKNHAMLQVDCRCRAREAGRGRAWQIAFTGRGIEGAITT